MRIIKRVSVAVKKIVLNEVLFSVIRAAETRNAMPASSRSKGQFQLDFEEIDTSDNYVMPQLIEPDLNEILDEPVKLPVTR